MAFQGYLTRWIVLPSLLFTIAAFIWSAFAEGWLQGLLIELGATSLGILVAISYVDEVRRRHEEAEWKDVRELASLRLSSDAQQLREAIAWPLVMGRNGALARAMKEHSVDYSPDDATPGFSFDPFQWTS